MGGSSLLEELEGYLKILSFGLPLDGFYNDLNHNNTDLSSFYNECESLYSKKLFFKNRRLCSVLLRFLKRSNIRTKNENSAYDDCILFNYWMYNELSKIYVNNDHYKLVPAFGELQEIWNSLIYNESKSDYFNKCKPDFNIPQQVDWEKRKEFYDYCVSSDTIVQTANSFTNKCKDIYSYIKGKTHLYEHFKTDCPSDDEKKCPNFYGKCKDYHPDTVLPRLYCYKEMKKQEDSQPAAAGALSLSTQSDLPPSRTFSPEASQLKGDGTHPVTQTGNILLGVVATSLTSGALYRFTPLGRILRNRFGRNNNNMGDLHGGEYGLFDYAPESYNPFTGGGEEHYIGYQPA